MENNQQQLTGIEQVTLERWEHITKHGKSVASDKVDNADGDLSDAALALLTENPGFFPPHWDPEVCAKMIKKPFKDRLVKAGALIIAELDRMNEEEYELTTVGGLPIRVRGSILIHEAHDRLTSAIAHNDIGNFFNEKHLERAQLALDVLCWTLMHEHNKAFQRNLEELAKEMDEKGFKQKLA